MTVVRVTDLGPPLLRLLRRGYTEHATNDKNL